MKNEEPLSLTQYTQWSLKSLENTSDIQALAALTKKVYAQALAYPTLKEILNRQGVKREIARALTRGDDGELRAILTKILMDIQMEGRLENTEEVPDETVSRVAIDQREKNIHEVTDASQLTLAQKKAETEKRFIKNLVDAYTKRRNVSPTEEQKEEIVRLASSISKNGYQNAEKINQILEGSTLKSTIGPKTYRQFCEDIKSASLATGDQQEYIEKTHAALIETVIATDEPVKNPRVLFEIVDDRASRQPKAEPFSIADEAVRINRAVTEFASPAIEETVGAPPITSFADREPAQVSREPQMPQGGFVIPETQPEPGASAPPVTTEAPLPKETVAVATRVSGESPEDVQKIPHAAPVESWAGREPAQVSREPQMPQGGFVIPETPRAASAPKPPPAPTTAEIKQAPQSPETLPPGETAAVATQTSGAGDIKATYLQPPPEDVQKIPHAAPVESWAGHEPKETTHVPTGTGAPIANKQDKGPRVQPLRIKTSAAPGKPPADVIINPTTPLQQRVAMMIYGLPEEARHTIVSMVASAALDKTTKNALGLSERPVLKRPLTGIKQKAIGFIAPSVLRGSIEVVPSSTEELRGAPLVVSWAGHEPGVPISGKPVSVGKIPLLLSPLAVTPLQKGVAALVDKLPSKARETIAAIVVSSAWKNVRKIAINQYGPKVVGEKWYSKAVALGGKNLPDGKALSRSLTDLKQKILGAIAPRVFSSSMRGAIIARLETFRIQTVITYVIPAGSIYNFYAAAASHNGLGPVISMGGNFIVGKAKKAVSKKVAGAVAKKLSTKVVTKGVSQAMVTVVAPGIGNLIVLAVDFVLNKALGLIKKGVNLFKKMVLMGDTNNPEDKFILVVGGAFVLIFFLPLFPLVNFSSFGQSMIDASIATNLGEGAGPGGPMVPGAPEGQVVSFSYNENPNYPLPIAAAPPTLSPVSGGVCSQGPYGTFSHAGLKAYDLVNGIGAPVYATHDAFVVSYNQGIAANTFINHSYGNYVLLVAKTPDGQMFFTMYAHLLTVDPAVVAAAPPNPPALIHAGQQIGTEDATGSTYGSEINGTGTHLHYQYQGPGALTLPYTCY